VPQAVVAYLTGTGKLAARSLEPTGWTGAEEINLTGSVRGLAMADGFVAEPMVIAELVVGDACQVVLLRRRSLWENQWQEACAAPLDHRRSFDAAFERVSGAPLVVYQGAPGVLHARTVLSSGTSSTPEPVPPPPMGAPIGWVELVPSPSSDEIVLLFATTGASPRFHAVAWDGASWGAVEDLGPTVGTDWRSFAGAYEASGDFLAVWRSENQFAYAVRPAGDKFLLPVVPPIDRPGPVELRSAPGGNVIALAYLEHCCPPADNFVVGIWNGDAELISAISANSQIGSSAYERRVGTFPVDLAWAGEQVVAVYAEGAEGDTGGLDWALYQAGTWSAQPDTTTTPKMALRHNVRALPLASPMFALSDADGALWVVRYEMGKWLDAVGGRSPPALRRGPCPSPPRSPPSPTSSPARRGRSRGWGEASARLPRATCPCGRRSASSDRGRRGPARSSAPRGARGRGRSRSPPGAWRTSR
jgi:hypothetical protein